MQKQRFSQWSCMLRTEVTFKNVTSIYVIKCQFFKLLIYTAYTLCFNAQFLVIYKKGKSLERYTTDSDPCELACIQQC